MKNFLLLLGTIFCLSSIYAVEYYTVIGKIFDSSDKLVLPNAYVMVVGESGVGVIADIEGNYKITVDKKEVELSFRYTSYQDVKKTITFDKGNTVIKLDVGLSAEAQQLDDAVVTSTRYKMNPITSTQSMAIVGVKSIERENAMTLDKALKNVSGLTIVDNEPQMRGGSGFSSGMGSRVMIMLDEMPILRADAGRPAWNLIPMEDVAQIEILKGASSVMFGSAAINGAINVRTQFAKDEPISKVSLYGGFYNKPQNKSKSPWGNNTIPINFGASVAHSRKIKKFDLTMGVEYADDDGYRGRETKMPNGRGDSANLLVKAERRIRANVGGQYNIGHGWTASVGINFMHSNNNQSHFWYDAKQNIYNTYPGTLSHFLDMMLFIDPQVQYIDRWGGIHSLKNRILMSDNQVINIGAQDAASTTVYDAYQYKKTLNKQRNWQVLAGLSNQYAKSKGTVFSGNVLDIGSVGEHYANNFAFFAKTEIDFLKQKNLNVNFGARWEFAQIDNFSENRPIFQLGINYFIPKSQTYFRGNIGQGYRVATIGERYITTIIGSYGFYPNTQLKSETSVNTEIGIKQLFRFGGFEGFLDVAGFYQTYDNYIEFCMGPFKPNKTSQETGFGFKFFNTGPAVIKGIEGNIAGQGKIGYYFIYQVNLGYTYSLPQALDPNYVYASVENFDYTLKSYSSNPNNDILKYRIQHVGKADVTLTFIKRFSLGFTAKYFSQMKNMDKPFYAFDILGYPFFGMKDFIKRTENGSWVFDIRFAFEMDKFTTSVIVNNMLNTEYSLRPLHVEPTRLISLAINYKFNDINPGKFFRQIFYTEEQSPS